MDLSRPGFLQSRLRTSQPFLELYCWAPLANTSKVQREILPDPPAAFVPPMHPTPLECRIPKIAARIRIHFVSNTLARSSELFQARHWERIFGGRLQSHHHQCELINSCDRRLALSSFP